MKWPPSITPGQFNLCNPWSIPKDPMRDILLYSLAPHILYRHTLLIYPLLTTTFKDPHLYLGGGPSHLPCHKPQRWAMILYPKRRVQLVLLLDMYHHPISSGVKGMILFFALKFWHYVSATCYVLPCYQLLYNNLAKNVSRSLVASLFGWNIELYLCAIYSSNISCHRYSPWRNNT